MRVYTIISITLITYAEKLSAGHIYGYLKTYAYCQFLIIVFCLCFSGMVKYYGVSGSSIEIIKPNSHQEHFFSWFILFSWFSICGNNI